MAADVAGFDLAEFGAEVVVAGFAAVVSAVAESVVVESVVAAVVAAAAVAVAVFVAAAVVAVAAVVAEVAVVANAAAVVEHYKVWQFPVSKPCPDWKGLPLNRWQTAAVDPMVARLYQ